MRNLLLIALFALCFAFQGTAEATTPNLVLLENVEEAGEIDPALVEAILRHIQQEYDYDYECLCSQLENGYLTIKKNSSGYLVLLEDGGIILAILDEEL